MCDCVHSVYLISVLCLVYMTAFSGLSERVRHAVLSESDTRPNYCEKQEILQSLTMALFHLICHCLCKD